jgi:hypothetical protein
MLGSVSLAEMSADNGGESLICSRNVRHNAVAIFGILFYTSAPSEKSK